MVVVHVKVCKIYLHSSQFSFIVARDLASAILLGKPIASWLCFVNEWDNALPLKIRHVLFRAERFTAVCSERQLCSGHTNLSPMITVGLF